MFTSKVTKAQTRDSDALALRYQEGMLLFRSLVFSFCFYAVTAVSAVMGRVP